MLGHACCSRNKVLLLLLLLLLRVHRDINEGFVACGHIFTMISLTYNDRQSNHSV